MTPTDRSMLDPEEFEIPRTNAPDQADQSSILVQVEKVSKRYGKITALDGVSFDVYKGDALALWGPNGAGKSTLIKAFLGLVDISGRILVNGQDTHLQGKAARNLIGYVPQESTFYDMSLISTLSFYGRIRKIDRSRIAYLVGRLGLEAHTSKRVSALSGGLKQRLALALALLSDPPILLMDEPTANLDLQSRRDYLVLLSELHEEQKTVIFASHRLEEVEVLANRVLLMDNGNLKSELTPYGLRKTLSSLIELTVWIGDEQRQQALELLRGHGYLSHLNGRGTVVVQAESGQKLLALDLLQQHGISIIDFETNQSEQWT